MIIFGGQKSTGLAWEVAKELKKDLGKIEFKKFPDEEIYLRVDENVEGKECVVIQSIRTSDDLLELLLILDALKDHGCLQAHAVIPYLAYTRQDKSFKSGEPVSAKTVLKLIDEIADSITTINCHFLNDGGESVFHGVRFMNLDATETLTEYFKPKLSKPIAVAPDNGSISWARNASEILKCEFNHLDKKRISGTEVTIKNKELDVKGKDVLILDDIISTGGTIVEACKVIRGWRPASINVGCVHGLFLNGIQQFQGVVDTVVATNTLSSNASKVSVAKLIAKSLK